MIGAALWWTRQRRLPQPLGLDEFVRASLIGIVRGVRHANDDLTKGGPAPILNDKQFFLEPTVTTQAGRESVIEFDVAVMSRAGTEAKIAVVSGRIEGGGSSAHVRESHSRMKFVVYNKNYVA